MYQGLPVHILQKHLARNHNGMGNDLVLKRTMNSRPRNNQETTSFLSHPKLQHRTLLSNREMVLDLVFSLIADAQLLPPRCQSYIIQPQCPGNSQLELQNGYIPPDARSRSDTKRCEGLPLPTEHLSTHSLALLSAFAATQ